LIEEKSLKLQQSKLKSILTFVKKFKGYKPHEKVFFYIKKNMKVSFKKVVIAYIVSIFKSD